MQLRCNDICKACLVNCEEQADETERNVFQLVVEAASGAAVYAGVHLARARGLRKVGVVLCGGNTWWLPPALKQ